MREVQGQAGPRGRDAWPQACSVTLPQNVAMVGGNSYFMDWSRNAGEELEGLELSLHSTCHKLTVALRPDLSVNSSWFIQKPSSKSLRFNTCRIAHGVVDCFQKAS